jgi:hypothetical protein
VGLTAALTDASSFERGRQKVVVAGASLRQRHVSASTRAHVRSLSHYSSRVAEVANSITVIVALISDFESFKLPTHPINDD